MKRVGKRAVLTVRKSLKETPRGVNLASQILLEVYLVVKKVMSTMMDFEKDTEMACQMLLVHPWVGRKAVYSKKAGRMAVI